MAHWFHRNPLKSTEPVKFELKGVLVGEQSSKICSELRLLRVELLEHLESASTSLEMIEQQFSRYLALMHGFLFNLDPDHRGSQNSKLRYLLKFHWSHSMLGTDHPIKLADVWYEVLNIIVQTGIWFMKRAAWISAKDEVNDLDAKNIHRALKRGAGLFEFVLENSDKLDGMHQFPGSDFDSNILQAYVGQCCAEAQEIALGRAIELKHSPSLISALATDTAAKYQKCEALLESNHKLNPQIFEKWRCYFQLKRKLYEAYAYAYLGEMLLAEDKCGEGIRACKAGIEAYKETEDVCKKYADAKGPGFCAKPEQHLFFRKVEPMLRRHLEKAERENSMIYHQTVPVDCPSLEATIAKFQQKGGTGGATNGQTFGVAKSDPFELPPKPEQWTLLVYQQAFNISRAPTPDFKKAERSSKKLEPVKEEKLYSTDRDPSNRSGCVLS